MSATKVPVKKPYTLKTASVLIKPEGGSVYDFTDHIGSITFTPSTEIYTFNSVGGSATKITNATDWTAGMNIIQDLDISSLHRMCLKYEGQKAEVLATFVGESDPVKMTIVLIPGLIGGQANGDIPTASIDFPVEGSLTWQSGLTLE